MTIQDKNEENSFHPSLDIKNGVTMFGFKVKNSKDADENIFVVSAQGATSIVSENKVTCGDKTYPIDIRKRRLNKLSTTWGADNLNSFYESLENGSFRFNGIELYMKIKELMKKYLLLENEADYTLLTAWVMGTYVFPIFDAYPYIHIKAPKGSGKSQCLNFIKLLAFNARKARATLPALRETVDALRGTFLIDQADVLSRQNSGDFLDILTDSYKKSGGEVNKMIKVKDNWEVQEFEAYCPKGFASINELPEDLRDRCIIIPLIRSTKNVKHIDEGHSAWKSLRDKLYTMTMSESTFVDANYSLKFDEYKQSGEIVGRPLELWLPIETVLVSFYIDAEEVSLAKKRFLSRYEFASYQTTALELAIIKVVLKLLGDKEEKALRPKEIAEEIDTDLFDEDSNQWTTSMKQKSSKVGFATGKFNLATQKLKRDSYGEKYLFSKKRIEDTYKGYFNTEDSDTPRYKEEETIENAELF